MNWLLAEQARRNALGHDRWTAYAPHREQLMATLVRMRAKPEDRLCVLGAGNVNNLDLTQLCRIYREVHLVDIDAEALRHGAGRQPSADASRLYLHGGVELTGCWGELSAAVRGTPLTADHVQTAIELAERGSSLDLPGPFDVVASTCVVSQLIDGGVLALGEGHPRLLELIFAIRTAHLRLLSRLTTPGGRGFLATDFVSSVTLAELAERDEPDWPSLLAQCLPRGNFFHGLNPCVLHSLFSNDERLAAEAGDAALTGFWRWRQGSRTYAVCALEFARRA